MANTPLRIAIVGSGPAGLFTADELLRKRPGTLIDVHERLPAPFGLVRYGVAPDHPHMRRVSKLLETVLVKPGLTLHLGSQIGTSPSLQELRASHDAVILATGAYLDRALGLAGESLTGIWPSTHFSGWVNGHPHCRHRTPPPEPHTVAILGNGNVALDAARLLARPIDFLRGTEIDPAALDALAQLDVHRILVIGRRGPAETSFGLAELEEVSQLAGWHVSTDPFAFTDEERSFLSASDDRTRDVAALMERIAQHPPPAHDARRIIFVFQHAPASFIGTEHVTGVRLQRTRLEGDLGQRKAVGTGEFAEWPADWVIKATGHLGERLEGLPFDPARGVIPNEAGRVQENGAALPGVYVVGWIKRGAKGLIGHNRRDAMDTVASLLADFPA